ncbi:MAG: MFS transporter [Sphingobium sp.]
MTKEGNLYNWYVVIFLLIVSILSYFDRFIISLLVDPIKSSLNLTDLQMGLLLGPAFSLFHIIVSLPLGWYADLHNRKYLLIISILIWCSMTAASGFAASFLPLLLLRFGLGIAEATVLPCSISLISDYFNKDKRGRAISVFMAGTYLGAGLAFLVGGSIVAYLAARGDTYIFGMGPFEPWQMTFFWFGVPGFLVVLFMLTIREPKRRENVGGNADDPQSGVNIYSGVTQYMLDRWQGFFVLFVASACNVALSTLAVWNIALFVRVWEWNVATIGAITGVLYFTAGPLGTTIAIWAMDRLNRRYPSDGTLRTLMLGLLIGVPACALYPVMPTPELAVVLMFVAFVGKSVGTASGPAALTLIVPPKLYARSTAVFYAVISIFGALLGPPLVGWAVDLMGDPKALGVIMSGFVICIGLPSLIIVALGMGHYRKILVSLEPEAN